MIYSLYQFTMMSTTQQRTFEVPDIPNIPFLIFPYSDLSFLATHLQICKKFTWWLPKIRSRKEWPSHPHAFRQYFQDAGSPKRAALSLRVPWRHIVIIKCRFGRFELELSDVPKEKEQWKTDGSKARRFCG